MASGITQLASKKHIGKTLAMTPTLTSHREAGFSMLLLTHCIAPAHNGLQTASALRSMGTKAELSKPYKGK